MLIGLTLDDVSRLQDEIATCSLGCGAVETTGAKPGSSKAGGVSQISGILHSGVPHSCVKQQFFSGPVAR
jgi:hypothetical protein